MSFGEQEINLKLKMKEFGTPGKPQCKSEYDKQKQKIRFNKLSKKRSIIKVEKKMKRKPNDAGGGSRDKPRIFLNTKNPEKTLQKMARHTISAKDLRNIGQIKTRVSSPRDRKTLKRMSKTFIEGSPSILKNIIGLALDKM